jgi:PleD family two-component response regulator
MMARIYIAEDSPTQALRVRRILQALPGVELRFFADGLEAYQATLQSAPDLLLLDLILPTLHGLAVCRLLKFHENHKHIPVLIFSSITESEISGQASHVGADAYLRKPFTSEQLTAEVQRLLSKIPKEPA